MRRRKNGLKAAHVAAVLAAVAVPAVGWALPQPTTGEAPSVSAPAKGGGGGGAAATEPAGPGGTAPARPAAAAPGPTRAQPGATGAGRPEPARPLPGAGAQPQPGTAGRMEPTAESRPPGMPGDPAAQAAPPPATAGEPAAGPAGAPAATAPAAPGAPEAADPVARLMADAVATAASMHGAVAVRDWELAKRHGAALRDQLARMAEPDLRAPGLRDRAIRLQRLTPALDAAIARQDAFRANDAAYRLVYGLLEAINVQAASRGGGGGTPAAPAPRPVVPPPIDHLRQGYPEVVKAHAALLAGDPVEAKAHLDTVREHLTAAIKAKPGAVFGRRLDDLNKRRWRVVAALADPVKATRMSVQLTRAYAEAVHAVGQYASVGGGGGTPAARARASAATGWRGRNLSAARIKAVQKRKRDRLRGVDAIPYNKRDI